MRSLDRYNDSIIIASWYHGSFELLERYLNAVRLLLFIVSVSFTSLQYLKLVRVLVLEKPHDFQDVQSRRSFRPLRPLHPYSRHCRSSPSASIHMQRGQLPSCLQSGISLDKMGKSL